MSLIITWATSVASSTLSELMSIVFGVIALVTVAVIWAGIDYLLRRYRVRHREMKNTRIAKLLTGPDHLHGIDGGTYVVEIWLESDAFQHKPRREIARLLRNLADEITHGRPFEITPLFDRNGITVGDAGVPKSRHRSPGPAKPTARPLVHPSA